MILNHAHNQNKTFTLVKKSPSKHSLQTQKDLTHQLENIIQNEWEVYIVHTALERVSPIFSGKAMEVFKMSMENVASNLIAEKLDLKLNSVNKLKNRVKERLLSEIAILKSEMHLFDE